MIRKNIKLLLIFVFVQVAFVQGVVSLDQFFAEDAYYRKDSWLEKPVEENLHLFHKQLAYSVVCAHELCEDPSSNIAAFGFSAHKADGTVLSYIKFPLLFSSGKLAPNLPSTLNICPLEERFSKTLDIMPPRQQLIRFVSFVRDDLKLKFDALDQVQSELAREESDQLPGVPMLRLRSGDLDVPLGYIKHCEQCFIFELFRNPDLAKKALDFLSKEETGTISFIALDIITYNDMCQRCFAVCDRYLPQLREMANDVLGRIIPLRIYVSSFRPFEINVSRKRSADFTRGTGKCSDYEKFSEQKAVFEGLDSGLVKNRTLIFQFFNPWMLEAQRDIERKKCVRSMIRAMSDVVPFIYEALPEKLSLCNNKKQISLENAAQSFEKLCKIKGEASFEVKAEIDRVKSLAEEAHRVLVGPLTNDIERYGSILSRIKTTS